MYYRKKERDVRLDPAVVDAARKIALERPSYGTRRMAVMVSRELGRAVNRKQVQRIFHALNWIEPSKKKADIIRSKGNVVRASRPNELWETYIKRGQNFDYALEYLNMHGGTSKS